MAYNKKTKIAVSISLQQIKCSSMFTVLQTSAFGLYIALQENDHRTHPYLIQGTKYSFKRVRENEIENIWPKIPMNQSLYYLHLNAHLDQVTHLKEQLCERRRNTDLFVNNKVDKKSHGKRILTRSGAYWQSNVDFFSNKNEPLYVYSTQQRTTMEISVSQKSKPWLSRMPAGC